MSLIHRSLFSYNLKRVHTILKKADKDYYEFYFNRKHNMTTNIRSPPLSSSFKTLTKIKLPKKVYIKSLLSDPKINASISTDEKTQKKNNKKIIHKSFIEAKENKKKENPDINENRSKNESRPISKEKENESDSDKNGSNKEKDEDQKESSKLKQSLKSYFFNNEEEAKNFFITYKNKKGYLNYNNSALNLMDIIEEEENNNTPFNSRYFSNILYNNIARSNLLYGLPNKNYSTISQDKTEKDKQEENKKVIRSSKKIKTKIKDKKILFRIKSARPSDVTKNYYIDNNNNIVEKVDKSCQSIVCQKINNKMKGLIKSKSLNKIRSRFNEQRLIKQKYLKFLENKSFILRANYIMNNIQETRGDKQKLRSSYNPLDV